nr:MAG TPA: hypothetical protein [Caudoviricetes sp.]
MKKKNGTGHSTKQLYSALFFINCVHFIDYSPQPVLPNISFIFQNLHSKKEAYDHTLHLLFSIFVIKYSHYSFSLLLDVYYIRQKLPKSINILILIYTCKSYFLIKHKFHSYSKSHLILH